MLGLGHPILGLRHGPDRDKVQDAPAHGD